MNFGKLLAYGKSIIPGRGGMAYKVDPNVYLPKFDSAKNPFAKPGTPLAPPANEPVKTPEAVNRSTPFSAPAKPAVLPAFYATPPSTHPAWAKLNPLAMFRGQSGQAARNLTAVQTELSLDSVKVIENDLRDAEVEVVPIKSRPARPAKRKPGEPVEETWNDLGTKIFGANAV